MNIARTFVTAALAIAAGGIVGCGSGGVEGTYKLDSSDVPTVRTVGPDGAPVPAGTGIDAISTSL